MTDPFDVYCLGDALLDFLPDVRGPLRQARKFEAHLGGAVVNVAVGLARLGKRVCFQGVVGEDELGRGLALRIADEGVTPRLRYTTEAPTALIFVGWDASGDRSFFSPTSGKSADKRLEPEDIDPASLANARWFHCGSNTHVLPPAREALFKAANALKARRIPISFDPNVRPQFWPDLKDLRALCLELVPFCTLVKLSEEELEPCTGRSSPDAALDWLLTQGVSLACVTLGARGAQAACRTRNGLILRLSVPSPQIQVVDTTGAGDGFVSALLSRIVDEPPEALSSDALERHLRFACWSASRVCTVAGAVPGLPTQADVLNEGP